MPIAQINTATNTFWPPEEFCEIIDDLNSKLILSHFETAIFNSRGVSVRSAFDGGSASALLSLAKGYERDAKEEDDRAHLDELR